MTEHDLLPRRRRRWSRAAVPAAGTAPPGLADPDTVPTVVVTTPHAPALEIDTDADIDTDREPTLFGLPADADRPGARLITWRRPDALAGMLLLVAGTCGGLGLFLPWAGYGDALGLRLAQDAVRVWMDDGVAALPASGLLLPLTVALAGGVLVLAGLLAFVRARTHRTVGVLALAVSLTVAGGVVVRVADADPTVLPGDAGLLCAVVLAGVALLGALKAMVTAAEVTVHEG